MNGHTFTIFVFIFYLCAGRPFILAPQKYLYFIYISYWCYILFFQFIVLSYISNRYYILYFQLIFGFNLCARPSWHSIHSFLHHKNIVKNIYISYFILIIYFIFSVYIFILYFISILYFILSVDIWILLVCSAVLTFSAFILATQKYFQCANYIT